MREQRAVAWGESVPVVATAAALWLSGVVALPVIFGEMLAGFVSAVVWLVVALVLAAGLLALLPRLARLLAAGLARLSAALASPDVPSSATFTTPELRVVARLIVLAAELLIIQAVLRRPLALVLGGAREAASVEAGIAAGALTVILLLLVWTYQTTRPLVQAATLRAIDAAIPTIGTVSLSEPVTRGSHIVAPPTQRQAADDDKTAPSRRRQRPSADDTTERAATGDATLATPAGADDKTIASPHVADKTVVSSHVPDDETVVSPPRSDEPRTRGG